MARFGTFLYGSRQYGESGRLSAGSQIFAQVLDYGRIEINIYSQEQPVTEQWTYVLLRKNNGTSEEPADGAPIASGKIVDSVTTIIDEAALADVSEPFGWVYYTLFVFDTAGQWIRDCATFVTAPRNLEFGKYVVDRLPRVLTSKENNPIDPPDYESMLYQFLSGLGVSFDTARTSLTEALPENIRRVNQASPLHHVLASGLGMNPEPGIGLAASARLFRQAGDIYRKKGTLAAVEAYVEALTGWTTTATESNNLLMDLDDASFESSVGGWIAEGATISVRPPDETIPVPFTPYDSELSPFAREGIAEVIPDGSPDPYIQLRPGLGRTGQIPVKAGNPYYLNLDTVVLDPADGDYWPIAQDAEIVWYDESRSEIDVTIPIATGAEAGGGLLTNQVITPGWDRFYYAFLAPDGARFASIRIKLSGGEKYYFDRVQLSEAPTPYQDPRTVNIICAPRRINLLTRPNEGLGTFYWTANEGTVAETTGGYVVGTYSLQFSPDATSGNYIAMSESVPAREGYLLNFSGYFSGDPCNVRLAFYDADDNEIELRVPTEEEQQRTTTNVPGLSQAGDWNRVDIQALTPEGAATVRVVTSGTGTSLADLMILERSDRPQWYFDYVLADLAAEDALYRQASSTNRYSLLYPNRIIKLARIKQEIENYLPLGVRARVLLWDSYDPQVTAQLPYGV